MSDFDEIQRVPFWKLRPRMPFDKTAKHYALFGLIVFLLSLFYVIFIKAPVEFPSDTYFEIKEGAGLLEISQHLKEQNIIRSRFSFQAFMVILGRETGALAGDYYFEKPISSIRVANRFAEGIFELERYSVFLQEGFTINQYASILEKKLPRFNKDNFIQIAKEKEGYLFPDSYFFFETADEYDVIETLEKTFKEKTEKLHTQAEMEGVDFDNIIIMASLIQREANNISSEMKMISGILWNRIEKGMLLQVDATFKYYLNKPSSKITKTDLAEDHPYNTYVNKGLPPGPIGNPGLKAIDAALNPKDNNYVFYLHDKTGKIHYATTYDQHVNNKNTYLK